MSGSAGAGLIGRTKECRALDELLGAVRGGESRVLVLRGDAGIGKSALVQHVTDAASGFRVLTATGVESEMEFPFAALQQLCSPLLDRLDGLPEPQRAAAGVAFGLITGGAPDRVLIGLAVLTLLSAASEERPLLCVVDDAHLLDRESVQALAFVARRLLAESVGFVFVTRDAIGELGAFPELIVERLRDGDAHTLLSAVLQVPIDERVRDRIVAETRGNPLALVEWPRGRTAAELAGGFGLPEVLPMTGQIEESFRRRLDELPGPTRRFLTVAAAEPTGDPVLVWRAAGVLGISPGDATPALEAGLVELGTRVSFRHPMVRSAAYSSASLTDRQAAHRALADATDAGDPDRRSWHRALGAASPDDDIAEALVQSAGHVRARGGVAAAAALLERAVSLTNDPLKRAQRILAAADAHLEAGSYESSAALLSAAEASRLDDVGRVQLDLLRARHAAWGGDIRNAPALAYRASAGLELIAPESAGLPFLQALAIGHIVGDAATGVDTREIARATSKRELPPEPSVTDLLVLGMARLHADGLAAAAPILRRALDMSAAETFQPDDNQILGFCAAAANELWDLDTLHTLTHALVAMTRTQGALTMLPIALSTMAHALLLRGDFDSAALALAEARQILEATGSSLSSYTTVAAEFAGLRGGSEAATLIDEHIATARALDLRGPLTRAFWASATLHNGAGQYARALDAAIQANENRSGWGARVFLAELIEAAARCGRPLDATAAREQLTESADASGSDWALGVERRSEALFAEGAVAEALYRESIDRLHRTPLRPDLGRAHLLYGEWLRRDNRRVDARAQLRIAFELFTTIGMRGFAERARHELAATGETVRKRTADSFDELTPQEAHIARLAADGHTNPEIGAQLFISARTVEWHLRKVFTKLGVTSRRELRTALPRSSSVTSSA